MFYLCKSCKITGAVTLKLIKKWFPLTIEQLKSWKISKVGYICEENFLTKNKDHRKVRGHCYITRKFRGAAHCICNILKLFSEKSKQNEWNEKK